MATKKGRTPGEADGLISAVEKWSFGVNVVLCIVVLIGMLTWRVLSLPEDDSGGFMIGAMVVTGIEFVRNLVILEIVRRVFLWKVRSS